MRKILSILSTLIVFLSYSCEENESVNFDASEIIFGLQPTPESELKSIPVTRYKNYAGDFPDEFYLNTPPPESNGQGSEGSCVGWATAYGLMSTFLGKPYYTGDLDYSAVCSPEYIYNQIKVGGCGSGTYFSAAFDLLVNQGVCTWTSMPYTDEYCDLMPDEAQRNEAAENKLKSYSLIKDYSEANLKSLLLNNYPIVIGAKLDEGFMSADKDFIWRELKGGFVGNHAMLIVGYNDDKNAYKILNSWSSSWADGGYTWLDYNFFGEVIFEAYTAESAREQSERVIELNGNLDFGEVTINQTAKALLSITNTGKDELTVEHIDVPNGFSADYSGVVLPGATVSVDVSFTPTSEKEYSGILTVISNATGGSNTIAVKGTGVEEPTGNGYAVIYAASPNRGWIDIQVDGSPVGSIVDTYTGYNEPDCSENLKAKSVTLTNGTHTCTAKATNGQTWNIEFEVRPDECTKVRLD